MFRPRWYSGDCPDDEPLGIMQRDRDLTDVMVTRNGAPKIPETILRLAHAEYERQYPGQDYERMQERGGLSLIEVVCLLADHCERLGGEPSAPRQSKGRNK